MRAFARRYRQEEIDSYLETKFFHVMMRRGYSWQDLQDASQQATLYVMSRYDQLDETVSPTPLRTWIVAITKYRLIDIHRVRSKEKGDVLISALTDEFGDEKTLELLGAIGDHDVISELLEHPIVTAVRQTIRKYKYDYRNRLRLAVEVLEHLLVVYEDAHEKYAWEMGFPASALADSMEVSRATIHRRLTRKFRQGDEQIDVQTLIRQEYQRVLEGLAT